VECPNCAFQNTPGMTACVRCAGRLDFSGVDVIPRRAPTGTVARAAGRARSFVGCRARDLGASLSADLLRPRWMASSFDGVTPAELFACVLPGLAQVRRGHRTLGRTLMGIWAFLLLVALLNIGSTLSVWATLGAISTHCTAVTLLLSGVLEAMPLWRRMGAGLMVYAAIAGLIYLPVYLGFSSVVRVIPIISRAESSVVQAGDVLIGPGPLVGGRAPQRGDIVLYHMESVQVAGAIIRSGVWIDRVLGVPGDRVEVRAGTVLLNGEPLAGDRLPLGSVAPCPDMELVAGDRQYIILPTLVSFAGQGADGRRYANQAMMLLSVVPRDSIEAEVTWRLRPWSRAGRLSGPTPAGTAAGGTSR
jgi:hypothetical protein